MGALPYSFSSFFALKTSRHAHTAPPTHQRVLVIHDVNVLAAKKVHHGDNGQAGGGIYQHEVLCVEHTHDGSLVILPHGDAGVARAVHLREKILLGDSDIQGGARE